MQAVPCPARFLDEAYVTNKVRRNTGVTGSTLTSSSQPQGVIRRDSVDDISSASDELVMNT